MAAECIDGLFLFSLSILVVFQLHYHHNASLSIVDNGMNIGINLEGRSGWGIRDDSHKHYSQRPTAFWPTLGLDDFIDYDKITSEEGNQSVL